MNETFEYDAIRAARKEIRLVILGPSFDFKAPINCTLRTVSLQSNPKPEYEALSYVWGDATITAEIFLNGRSFQVTTNLESALRHLRLRNQPRVLWADAIAINQSDMRERESQVAIMGLVYECASCDLLWMGSDSERYRYATYVLGHHFSDDKQDTEADFIHLVRSKPSVWKQLMDFFEAAVWQRIWIVQELTLASEIRVICGFKKLEWKSLSVVASILNSPSYVERVPPSAGEGLVQVTHITTLRSYQAHKGGPRNDLLWLWYAFGWGTCQMPQDKIFAILNILTDRMGIRPEYNKPIGSLFCEVAKRSILSRQDLKILGYHCTEWPAGAVRCTSIGQRSNATVAGYTVPSWCPDFGSALQPGIPRFFVEQAKRLNGIPWSSRCSRLLCQPDDPTKLVLLGLQLDRVVMVTEPTTSWSDDRIIEQYCRCLLDKFRHPRSSITKYFNGDAIEKSYWMTICGGLSRSSKDSWELTPFELNIKVIASTKEKHSFIRRFFGCGGARAVTSNELPAARVHESDDDYLRNAMLLETTRDHSFSTTKKGYMALVPDTSRPGDIICVLYGGPTPFVLRPAQCRDDACSMTLIGPAYVHGFMDGLPLKWRNEGRLKDREFVLV